MSLTGYSSASTVCLVVVAGLAGALMLSRRRVSELTLGLAA